jgi:hypothetical protein
MPIEISELVTRVTIMDKPQRDDERPRAAEGAASLGQEALIQECVRQVLRILRQERER